MQYGWSNKMNILPNKGLGNITEHLSGSSQALQQLCWTVLCQTVKVYSSSVGQCARNGSLHQKRCRCKDFRKQFVTKCEQHPLNVKQSRFEAAVSEMNDKSTVMPDPLIRVCVCVSLNTPGHVQVLSMWQMCEPGVSRALALGVDSMALWFHGASFFLDTPCRG